MELDNSQSDDPAEGAVLSAVVDEREYVESAIAVGSALLAYHPGYEDRVRVETEGPPYSYSRYVEPRVRYSLGVAMPVERPGEKQLEAMSLRNLRHSEFKVNE